MLTVLQYRLYDKVLYLPARFLRVL